MSWQSSAEDKRNKRITKSSSISYRTSIRFSPITWTSPVKVEQLSKLNMDSRAKLHFSQALVKLINFSTLREWMFWTNHSTRMNMERIPKWACKSWQLLIIAKGARDWRRKMYHKDLKARRFIDLGEIVVFWNRTLNSTSSIKIWRIAHPKMSSRYLNRANEITRATKSYLKQ